MYNFNNYEIMREPMEIDQECEYIYVTDNPDLQKQTKVWKIVVEKDLEGLPAFDKCYKVRFNLFKYCSTNTCIYLDGSIQIRKSLYNLFDAFEKSGSDIGLNVHPDAETMIEEYQRWVLHRGYDKDNANRILSVMNLLGYDLNYKGLFQLTCRICRNTEINSEIDKMTYHFLQLLGNDGKIERLDQTAYSFIVNKYFQHIKIFPFSQQIFQSRYMTWMMHGSTKPMPYNSSIEKATGYVFDRETELFRI